MFTQIQGAGPRRGLMLFLTAFLLLCGGAAPAAAQTGGLNGFVVDQVGTGIPNATIRATSGPSAGAQTTSSGTGSYFLPGLNPGSYVFTASATGYQSVTRSFTVTSGATARLDFALRSNQPVGGVLTGTVTRSDTRAPVGAATVQITGGAGTTPLTLQTGSNGVYRAENLSTGTYTVQVTRAGFTQQTRRVTVRTGQVTTINFALRLRSIELGQVQGTVTDTSGDRVPNATVRLLQGTTGPTLRTTRSGTYRFTGVLPDSYVLEVSAVGYETRRVQLTVNTSQRVQADVVLTPEGPATLVIQGFVVDEFLAPVRGARVQITSGPRLNQFDLTDSDGFYSLTDLPSGRYTLRATATGFQNDTETLDLDSSNQPRRVDFLLPTAPNQQRGSIAGRVTNGDDEGLQDVTVRVTAGPSTGQSVTTDADGDYVIEDLPVGTYALSFTRTGYASRTITGVDVSNLHTTELNVTLTENPTGTGVLSGTVRDSDTSTALSGVTVRLVQGGAILQTDTTGSDGGYAFSGLLTGNYTVRFSRTGYQTRELTAAVSQGQTTTLNTELVPTDSTETGTVTGLVRDNGGRPIQSALVELEVGGETLTARTDPDGRFRFEEVPVGTYDITASAVGLLDNAQRVTVNAGATSSITFTLTPTGDTGTLTGVVYNPSGLPLQAVVTLVAGPQVSDSRNTSSNGRFTFTGLPPGTYVLEARAARYRTRRIQLIVRAGSTTTTVVYLPR